METYRHTQRGTLVLAFTLGAALIFVVAALAASPGFWVLALVLALGAWLFSSLTVSVDREAVRWRFGPGLIRNSVRLTDVADAKPVRNKWWYGWGIRITPHGWLYNVSGLDAVQIDLKNGRTFRLGTDDPDGLSRAVRLAIG